MRIIVLVAGLVAWVGACGSKPISSGPGPDSCTESSLTFQVGYLPDEGEDRFPPVAQTVIADGLLFVHRRATLLSNAPTDLEIFAFQPATGHQTQVTANDVEDHLLDARDGALLIRRGDNPGEMIYRDPDREVSLGDATGLVQGAGEPGPRPRLVRRGRAAWLAGGQVHVFDGTSVRTVSDGLRNNSVPYLDGNLVVWSAWDGGDQEIYLHGPDGTKRLTDNAASDTHPVTSASRIFWLSDGAVRMRELRGTTERVLAEGPCHSLSTHQGRVLMSCAGTSELAYLGMGRRLLLFDGENVAEVPTLGGFVFSPRLYGRRLAWIEYDTEDALCYAESQGRVAVWSGRQGDPPQAVAPIGSACLCCGAYWPTPELSFEGDVLAWTYAVPEQAEPHARPTHLGYAVVQSQTLCVPAGE